MTTTVVRRLNPYRSASEWGTIKIGGKAVPGVVIDVDGHSKPQVWAVQMGIAVSNAVSVWRGMKLAETITIKTNLFDEASIDAYYEMQELLLPKLGKKPPSLPIVNAAINFAKIARVSCRDVLAPKAISGGSWQGEIQLIEYNALKPAPIGPADPPKAKTENDLLADELARAIAEAKRVSQ